MIPVEASWRILVPGGYAVLDLWGFHGEAMHVIGSNPRSYLWVLDWVDYGQDHRLAEGRDLASFEAAMQAVEDEIRRRCHAD